MIACWTHVCYDVGLTLKRSGKSRGIWFQLESGNPVITILFSVLTNNLRTNNQIKQYMQPCCEWFLLGVSVILCQYRCEWFLLCVSFTRVHIMMSSCCWSIAGAPPASLNWANCCYLLIRFYKLHTKGLCEVIPMTVPRKVCHIIQHPRH